MAGTSDHRPRAAPPTLAGIVLLLAGGIALFAAVVGYAWAPADDTGWDRLADGTSFGLPSNVVAIVGAALVVIALVLLGVGIGTARRQHHRHHLV